MVPHFEPFKLPIPFISATWSGFIHGLEGFRVFSIPHVEYLQVLKSIGLLVKERLVAKLAGGRAFRSRVPLRATMFVKRALQLTGLRMSSTSAPRTNGAENNVSGRGKEKRRGGSWSKSLLRHFNVDPDVDSETVRDILASAKQSAPCK